MTDDKMSNMQSGFITVASKSKTRSVFDGFSQVSLTFKQDNELSLFSNDISAKQRADYVVNHINEMLQDVRRDVEFVARNESQAEAMIRIKEQVTSKIIREIPVEGVLNLVRILNKVICEDHINAAYELNGVIVESKPE